jgi:hypothetical protein
MTEVRKNTDPQDQTLGRNEASKPCETPNVMNEYQFGIFPAFGSNSDARIKSTFELGGVRFCELLLSTF